MSIYSGFATRQLETFYNSLTSKLVELLTEKTELLFTHCKSLHLETDDHSDIEWARKIVKIYRSQAFMEQNKHMGPFYSSHVEPLVQLLKRSYVSIPD